MAAAIVGLMTGAAAAASAEMAAELGPCPAQPGAAMAAAVAAHRRSARGLADEAPAARPPLERAACPDEALLARLDRILDAAAERGARHGFRNAGVTLVAEAGLAETLLDAETPGVAPLPGPTRQEAGPSPRPHRELWPSLREGLRALRYREGEIADIEACAVGGGRGSAPHLRPEHAALLAAPDAEARIRMAAAVQAFVSAGVEQTAVLAPKATAADVQAAATLAWRLGLETLRLARAPAAVEAEAAPEDRPAPLATMAPPPGRDRAPLPDRRTGYTRRIVAERGEAYLHTGEYADGRLGEVFIDLHREDAALRGLMDELSSAVSLGLQHGVPLEAFVEAFVHEGGERADPASVLDAVFRDLAASYLGRSDLLADPPERMTTDRGRGRGSARGWRLPMGTPRPATPALPPPPAADPPAEAATVRPLPRLPRTDAYPIERLTGGKGK